MRNRFFPIRLINLILIIGLLVTYQTVSVRRADAEREAAKAAQTQAAEQNAGSAAGPVYNDGTYKGSAQGYGGTISVEVVIEDDLIKEINVTDHSGEGAAYWDMASGMINEMIEAQTPNVDTVAGATFSSNGIHNAVTEALKSALAN